MQAIERFFERAPWARSHDGEELRLALTRGLDGAASEHPDIPGDLPAFSAYVAEHLTPSGPLLEELASLHFADLYLAWAIGLGERRALSHFQSKYIAKLAQSIKRELLPPAGELEQAVLTRLLVAGENEVPKIRSYSGRGPLGAWLRMIATRVALDLRRGGLERHVPLPDLADVSGDPELDFLKQRYAGQFSEALEAALASLPHRDATLLKLTFVDGLSGGAIGTMYGVSGRTVQRWVADARELVLVRTSEQLKARLSLTNRELESLLGLVQSRLHISLERVLSQQGS
jgi:RNA polymerase sigma-70 factor, ECF subfamily